MLDRFSAVIFDMDGLLLDSERIALAAFNCACEHFGIGEHPHVFMRCIGTNEARGDQVLRDGLAGIVDHTEFSRVWDAKYLEATTAQAIPLKDGVPELLDHLSNAGVPAAVATSTATQKARQKLRDARLIECFEAIVGGDQVAKSKPHPDIYLKAAELLNVKPARCLALEDSENGVRAALAAGMTVIQVPDLVLPSEAFASLGHVILRSLRDVAGYDFESVRAID